jgi:alkylation response protein AidB-like acyl-CoA dehydrogenase
MRGRFPDGQLYVDLHGYGPDQPLPPADALAGFLRALGLSNAAMPQETAERAARFRTLVDQRSLMLVLDNARTVDQVRPLLPGTSTCAVLITSRDTLAGLAARDGAQRVCVDRMTAREAQQLHGGYGYAEEYTVSRLFVDARVLSIFEGADEVLALRVIARTLLAEAA